MISAGGDGIGFPFFEAPETRVERLPGIVPVRPGEFLAGAFQHIAVTLVDEAAAQALRDRLAARGVPMTPILEPGRFAPGVRMFLFPDPSGILLKAVWRSGRPA